MADNKDKVKKKTPSKKDSMEEKSNKAGKEVKEGSLAPTASGSKEIVEPSVLEQLLQLTKGIEQSQLKLAARMDAYDSYSYDPSYDQQQDHAEGMDYEEGSDLGPPPRLQDMSMPGLESGSRKRPLEDESGEQEVIVEGQESRFKAALDKFKKGEKTSSKIDNDLAGTINAVFTQGLPSETFADMKKDLIRPENCTGLSRVRVNSVFWEALPKFAQDLDARLQTVQESICKAGTLVAGLLQESNAQTEIGVKLMKDGMDAVAFLGHANANLNFRRKELLRPHIAPNFKHLCSATVPFTADLFGDDISRTVKEIQEVNKLSGVTNVRGRGRGHGRGYPRGGRGGYRGRGRGYNNPNFQGRQPYNAQSQRGRGKK